MNRIEEQSAGLELRDYLRVFRMYWRGIAAITLLVTLLAATAFFGTPDTLAMLRMMLAGVVLFVPGWLLARNGPGRG